MEGNFLPDLSCDIGKLLSIIAGWINNKDKSFYHSGNIPYSLKLLYLANNIEKQQKAVYYRSDIGPAFGSGCDLFIQNDNIFGNFSGHTYPEVKIIVSIPKVIVDYEVFQFLHLAR
ncbi:7572_t:CDS:2 [Funneliformis geosporum]|nr:7572_t:CDS:2 [Funneliformis geosporum]